MSRPIVQRIAAGGKEPAPLMTADELIARMEATTCGSPNSPARRAISTWGAAIRQSFHWIRREYRSRT